MTNVIFLRCGDKYFLKNSQTIIMGILNVTPDSFSDGYEFFEPKTAIAHGMKLWTDGADIIDVGGVSTAPFRGVISADEELRRLLPVIEGLTKEGINAISVDTKRACVARAAMDLGASWINDQSAGLFDPDMALVMAKADGVVIMHDGKGLTSGVEAGESVIYEDVVATIYSFLDERISDLKSQGVDVDKIIVDPGIGFGKSLMDSLTIIKNMHRFSDLGAASLVGVSRKSFLGKITNEANPKDRDAATLGAEAVALLSGTNILRTHNAKAARAMAMVVDRCVRK